MVPQVLAIVDDRNNEINEQNLALNRRNTTLHETNTKLHMADTGMNAVGLGAGLLGAFAGGSQRVLIMSRWRTVRQIGRHKYVNIKGRLVKLSDAQRLEKAKQRRRV